ncbi:MAG: hypothetical protein ACI8UR_000409 [Natronomonas sp.]
MNDRARVPFALVGVVLLISSTTLAATVGTHAPPGKPAADRAVDGATAELATALRGAADEAATDAATAPVTTRANTTAGRALNESQPFRDALRLRIYLRARARLGEIAVRRGGVTVTASLPAIEPTTEGYRTAIERVRVERAGSDGAALRVELDGVELIAADGNRIIATAERSPSFVIANPSLLLHDRTARFETRANAPATRPGTGRRLTARLYPLVWTRGYAQYGGAPVSNVLATRHVEVATNDALLAEQRAVFGAVDPAGRRGMAAAGRRVAVTDALAAVGGEKARTDDVLEAANGLDAAQPAHEPVGARRRQTPAPELRVGINASADRALADLVGIDSEDDLSRLIERVQTVEARVHVEREHRGSTQRGDDSAGSGWERTGVTTTSRVELRRADGTPPKPDGWKTRESATFDATITETTTRTWRRGNETRTTTATVERRSRIRVAVQARTLPVDGAPAGALDGRLANATERATRRATQSAGGLRGAARTAASGQTTAEAARATATAQHTTDRARLESRLRRLHQHVRNVSVTVSAPAAGGGRANPPALLRDELADTREGFRSDAGTTPQHRARLAAEAAYLDAVETRLETRADRHVETNAGIDDATAEYLDNDRLDGALAAHRQASQPTAESYTDPAGNLSLAVDTAPAYLPTGSVQRDRIDVRGGGSIRPLSTRNVNVFVTPHGRIAKSLVNRIPFIGGDRVALSTAAETLAAMDTSVPKERRRPLKRAVAASAAHVRGELLAAMVDSGISEQAARQSLETDATTADAALALANGTVVDEAVNSTDADGVERERLRLRLETTLDDALRDDAARPPRRPTTAAAAAARRSYRKQLETLASDGIQSAEERARRRALGKRMGSLPAGLPIAPVPGYWYATANVWYVSVGGTYERFAVRANRGGPAGATTYLRDGRAAWVHHDGERRRLGTATRVSFRTETAVVVVVPPGRSGVGDTNGVPDERSSGWPP